MHSGGDEKEEEDGGEGAVMAVMVVVSGTHTHGPPPKRKRSLPWTKFSFFLFSFRQYKKKNKKGHLSWQLLNILIILLARRSSSSC